MHIGLIGNYGATNVGDEAILEAILKSHPNHQFTVFSAHPEETSQRYGVKSVPLFPCGVRSVFKYGFRQSKKALQELDAVILGGGGLFQDDRLYACLIWAWQIYFVRRLKKPLFIYATGVGPLNTWLGKKLTKYVYDYAKTITIRDHYSFETLASMGILEQEMYTTSDPVFLFKYKSLLKSRTKNVYMISLRPWASMTVDKLDIIVQFLKSIKERSGAQFIFTVMQKIKEDDQRVFEFFKRHFDDPFFVPQNFAELMTRMGECEYAIGMRYHFAISAFLTGTPCLGIGYSPKVLGLFEDFADQAVPLSELSLDRLRAAWEAMTQNHERVALLEAQKATQLNDLAQKNVDLFESFFKNI